MARIARSYWKGYDRAQVFAGVVFAALVLLADPASAQDTGHTGTATPRTAPELSDLALFVMAVAGLWFTRRALRNRARKD